MPRKYRARACSACSVPSAMTRSRVAASRYRPPEYLRHRLVEGRGCGNRSRRESEGGRKAAPPQSRADVAARPDRGVAPWTRPARLAQSGRRRRRRPGHRTAGRGAGRLLSACATPPSRPARRFPHQRRRTGVASATRIKAAAASPAHHIHWRWAPGFAGPATEVRVRVATALFTITCHRSWSARTSARQRSHVKKCDSNAVCSSSGSVPRT